MMRFICDCNFFLDQDYLSRIRIFKAPPALISWLLGSLFGKNRFMPGEMT